MSDYCQVLFLRQRTIVRIFAPSFKNDNAKMNNKTYSNINNALGWLCFAIAATTYLSTVDQVSVIGIAPNMWHVPPKAKWGIHLEMRSSYWQGVSLPTSQGPTTP
jgi:hypothetical protein